MHTHMQECTYIYIYIYVDLYVCIYLKGSTTTTSVSLKNFKNWRTHTTEFHSILHSFINTSAGKVKVLQKQKTRPKIKIPPTKNTTQIALYVSRPFLALRVRVYVRCWFSP